MEKVTLVSNKFTQLSAPSFALAWAITAVLAYSLKVLFLSYFREHAVKLIRDITQLEIVDFLAKRFVITWQSYLSGLLQIFVYTFLITLLVAMLYNAFIRAKYSVSTLD